MNSIRFSSALILGLLVVSLFVTNCGDKSSGNDDDPTLDGNWALTQLIISSIITDTLTPGVDDISGTMALNTDSTFSSNVVINYTVTVGITVDTTISASGTWSATQDSITLTDPVGGSQTFAYDIASGSMVTTINLAVSTFTVALIISWKKQ